MAKTLAQGRKPGSGRKPGKGKTLREGRKPGSGRRRRQVTSTTTGLSNNNAVIGSGSTIFIDQQQQISLRDMEAADALTELTNSSPQYASSDAPTARSITVIRSGSCSSTTATTGTAIPNTVTAINSDSVSGVSSPQQGNPMTNTDDNNNDISKETDNVSRDPKPNVIEVVPPRPFLTYNRVLSASPQDTTAIRRDSTPLLPQVSSSPVYQNGSNGTG